MHSEPTSPRPAEENADAQRRPFVPPQMEQHERLPEVTKFDCPSDVPLEDCFPL